MGGRRFELEEVLSVTVRIWLRNLIPFLLLAALVNSPLIVGVVLIGRGSGLESQDQLALYIAGIWAAGTLLMPAIAGALTYGVVMQRQGQPAGLWACLKVGVRRFLPALVVSLVASLLTLLGFCALVIPGVILHLMWWVAVPVTVVERTGIRASMRRSRELTFGRKKEIFFLLVVIGAINRVANAAVKYLTLGGSEARTSRAAMHFLYGMVGMEILWVSFGSALTAVTYVLLRETKEGATAAELAAVFD